jgi:hypothetical protein
MLYAGEKFASEHGYTIYSHSGDGSNHATYIKEDLFLDVYAMEEGSLEGRLSKVFGMILCTLGTFSIPNKNFEGFEDNMKRIVQVL